MIQMLANWLEVENIIIEKSYDTLRVRNTNLMTII